MAVCHRIANDESLTASHVLISHSSEFNLTSCVENVEQGGFSIDDRLLLI